MRYLLDTNICIYLIKHRPPEVPRRFRRHDPSQVAISAITVFELEYGAHKSSQGSRARKALARFIAPLGIFDLDLRAAREAAPPIGPYDLLIAGMAKSNNLALVTNNTREFERVDGLTLENWVSA